MKTRVILKRLILAIVLISAFALIVCGFTGCGNAAKDPIQPNPAPDDVPVHTHTEIIDKAVEATCTSTGLTEGKHCSDCGEILIAQTEIPQKAHREEIIPKVESTCTKPGLTEGKKCSVCDEILVAQTEAPVKAHTEEIIPKVESTCTKTGLTEGKKCSACGEILVAQTESPIKAHSYDSDKDAVCNACGYERYCVHHNTVVLAGKAATCTATGLTDGEKCADCGEIIVTQEVISLKAHTEVVDPAVASTCTSAGLTEGKHCSVCSKILVEQTSRPLLDHVAGEWVVDKAATCTEDGANGKYCISCGMKMSSTITFSLGHVMSITVVREPSCTQNGAVRHECTRDGCQYSYEITTTAEHSMELEKMVDATCTTDGYIAYGCINCDYEETTIINGGHNYTSEITKKSTDGEKGEMTYTCSICLDSYTEEIPMLRTGISVLLIEDSSAWRTNTNVELLNTLVDAGYIAYWEKLDSSELDTANLLEYGMILIANDQTGFTYTNIVRNKSKLYNFAKDGGVLIYGACDQGWSAGNIGEALLEGVQKGNYYSQRNYIVNATHPIVTGALTDGISLTNDLLYHNYASHTYFTRLPIGSNIILQDAKGRPTLAEYKLGSGHVIVSGLTWEHNAKHEYSPAGSYANTVYDDLLVYATTLTNTCEHAYDDGVKHAATCTTSGYTRYTCTECGFAYKDDIVKPLGHTNNEWTQIQAPTCTEKGVESRTCTVCGEVQTKLVNAIPHTKSEWIVDKEPSCEKAGSRHIECIVCDATIQVETLSALGHDYSNNVCVICGKAISVDLEFTLNKDGESYSVAGIGNYTDAYVIIPRFYNGLPVTSIVNSAFSNNKTIEGVYIPDSVTSIGRNAFSYCESLESVIMTDSVTDIGERAFENSFALTDVTISRSLINIGASAFWGTNITSIVIPRSVVSIGECAFSNCLSLQSIVVEESNEYFQSIDENLYNKDGGILIQYSIGKNEASFTVPNSVTKIAAGAFSGCNLQNVYMTDSVVEIGNFAFSNSPKLKSVRLSNAISSIGNQMFQGCGALKDVVIPLSVTSIGDWAFAHTAITDITIPDSVVNVGNGAFSYCKSLTNVNISNSMNEIASSLFRNCNLLASIVIPESVTKIGSSAFSACTSLKSVEIPNSVIAIGRYTFDYCTSLTSVKIGYSVSTIDDYAFDQCYGLINIEVDEKNEYYKDIDGILYSKDGKKLIKYAAGRPDASFDLPDSVETIVEDAFQYCASLTSITISSAVTSIGDNAFYNCTSLISITIPNTVISIGEDAFYRCTSLTSVIIPDSVTSIGSYAFRNCSSLIIYCEAASQPTGWKSNWNYSNRPVVWGYTGE